MLPSLFDAADRAAAKKQAAYLNLRKVELLGLVAGATFGVMTWRTQDLDLAAVVALAALLAALAARVVTLATTPERRWYDARALAESVKSGSWQYSVGGEAFPVSDPNADEEFLAMTKELLESLPDLNMPAGEGLRTAITEEMRKLRSSDLHTRRQEYLEQRIQDQQDWYSKEANWNRHRATAWSWVLVLGYALAALTALLRSADAFDAPLTGLFISGATVALAWIQTKNYSSLSEAYSVTSHDVGIAGERLRTATSEEEFSSAVHDCEAAFSREHTLWRARQQHRP